MKDLNVNNSVLRQVPASGVSDAALTRGARGGVADTGFKEKLAALQNVKPSSEAPAASKLKFSNHAIERMQSRGISFSPEEMGKIEGAIGKAAAKGAKDTLLLTDNSALIVSVKDNTIVTVMDKASLKENVFTNIDSTVMI
jgi:flagellar operon protein